jgi:hypothetical protein
MSLLKSSRQQPTQTWSFSAKRAGLLVRFENPEAPVWQSSLEAKSLS